MHEGVGTDAASRRGCRPGRCARAWPALFGLALFGLVAGQVSAGAQAPGWPTKPLTLVVPYAAGGPTDLVGRTIAQGMSEAMGVQVIVENIGGAGGSIGTARVARAPADGYQFVLGGMGSLIMTPLTQSPPTFNAIRDFDPLGLISHTPLVLITRKDLPAGSLKEFVAYAKANPKLNYGSGGGVGNFSCMLLGIEAGIDIVHIAYRGAALAMQDLLAGRVDLMCEFISTALPQIKAGGVKVLATLSRDRTPMLPDLATAHEQGLAEFDIDSWLGLFVPKGTPPEIVKKLNAGLVAALDSETVKSRFAKVGVMIVPPERRSVEFLAKLMKSETDKWTGPITASVKAQK